MIPLVGHFVWIGPRLGFEHVLAVRSAAARGGLDRLVLHHADALDAGPELEAILAVETLELRRFDPETLLRKPLIGLYLRLESAAARADLVRVAILAEEGGVYLDADTLTVASLAPLCAGGGAFAGEEHIIFPASVRDSRSPVRWSRAIAQVGLRTACRLAPGGWRAFRRVEGWYPRAMNNAVLAGEPGHPVLDALLEAMAGRAEKSRLSPYALGPHLLQSGAARLESMGLVVHPPPVFYPLGPRVAEHWFRPGTARHVDRMLAPETRVIHWYASNRLTGPMSAAWVRERAEDLAFCRLARPFV